MQQDEICETLELLDLDLSILKGRFYYLDDDSAIPEMRDNLYIFEILFQMLETQTPMAAA